jgi:hypothetical protein
MTSTKIINAQTVPAAGGALLLAVKHSLAAATNAFNLEVELVNPAVPNSNEKSREFELVSITSNLDEVAAAFAAVIADRAANVKTINMRRGVSERTIDHTDVYAAHGGKLYVWVNFPPIADDATINVWVNEF